MNKYSIAIPTFNSSRYIKDCISPFLNMDIVNEIIISDDFSDNNEFQKLMNIINRLSKHKGLNIEIYRNNKNLGAFQNKFKAIEYCKNNNIYQIDSDNVPGKNIKKILSNLNIDKNLIYYPASIKQFRNSFFNRPLVNETLNLLNYETTVDLNFIISEIKDQQKIIDKNIKWLLNMGNFIVSKDSYLNTFRPTIGQATNLSADAVAISYFWIKSGKKIKMLNNFYHFHRKRADSVSFTEGHKSHFSVDYYLDKFHKLN